MATASQARSRSAGTKKVKVAVVQPRDILRIGMEQVLRSEGYSVVYSGGSGADFMRACMNGLCFDVLLLEVDMPKPDGFVVLGWLREHRPEVRTLVLGVDLPTASVQRAMRQRACTVLCAGAWCAELEVGLRSVLETGTFLSAPLRRLCAGAPDLPGPEVRAVPAFKALSRGELRLVQHLCAKDHPSLPIAAKRMRVKYNTVMTYCRRARKKLGVRSSRAIVALAIREGMVP